MYVAFDNHKNADFQPHILKSVDGGRSWTSIKNNLPENGVVYSIAEDHVNPKLLFVGTEYGIYFSIDGGGKWIQLKGGMPTIAVKDIAIQKRENDFVLATFGRGFYILDDYTPLRTLSAQDLEKEAKLFPVKQTPMYIQSRPLGLKGKSFQGESYFTADNPSFGATFTYYLKDAFKTKKKLRQEVEKETLKKNETVRIPPWEELGDEDNEEGPAVVAVISDETGNVVRRIQGTNSKGINRINWDLRYAATTPTGVSASNDDPFDEGEQGRLALPGKYTVRLTKRNQRRYNRPRCGTNIYECEVLGTSSLPAANRKELLEFQSKVGELQRAVAGAGRVANELKSKLALVKKALLDTPGASAKLRDDVKAIEERNRAILLALSGDNTLRSRNEVVPPSITERVQGIVDDQWLSTSAPTQTHVAAYEIAAEEFAPVLAKLKTLIEVDVKNLEAAMEAAGAPWTPGRVPEWKRK